MTSWKVDRNSLIYLQKVARFEKVKLRGDPSRIHSNVAFFEYEFAFRAIVFTWSRNEIITSNLKFQFRCFGFTYFSILESPSNAVS